ncbi:hypothetical protein AAG570_012188 [Ranatra chinensis]|uniref:Uncharacterized protein n=1 Tax=Ranatra chinensis TaxID=642074 RepID=A0ABD0YUF5_9HEMI
MLVISLVIVSLVAASLAAEDKFTTKFDSVDVEEVLSNERLYKQYFACLKGTGKCTPDGKFLKEAIPDALSNGCSKCSDKQKYGSKIVIKYLLEKRPDDYKILEKIYDPSGSYRKKYEGQL